MVDPIIILAIATFLSVSLIILTGVALYCTLMNFWNHF